jgi:hypothetical protein
VYTNRNPANRWGLLIASFSVMLHLPSMAAAYHSGTAELRAVEADDSDRPSYKPLFAKVSIDPNELIKFGQMTREEIIETLRKPPYNISVLILDEDFEPLELAEKHGNIPRLKFGNVKGQEKIAEFYTFDAITRKAGVYDDEHQKINKDSVGITLGQYFPRYTRQYYSRRSDADIERTSAFQLVLRKKRRPLDDKDILTVSTRIPKSYLLHEVAHILFDREEKPKIIETPDGKMGGKEIIEYQMAKSLNSWIEAVRAIRRNPDDASLRVNDAYLEYMKNVLASTRNQSGEEMDATMLVDFSRDLHMGLNDVRDQKNYFIEKYDVVKGLITKLREGKNHTLLKRELETFPDSTKTAFRSYEEILAQLDEELGRIEPTYRRYFFD